MYRKLVLTAACLTLLVVVVGAYVRLQDAGLGCPDWPGCYGHWIGVPDQVHDIERAAHAFPGRPVEAHKAWKEMFHRYIAGTLGVLLVAIVLLAWRRRTVLQQSPLLPTAIVVLIAVQATLGMWTVTMLLTPAIVTLHLLGGMSTLALMTWLASRQLAWPPAESRARTLQPWAAAGLAILLVQIALGGWVSTNYAALACPDFPACRGAWMPEMDFAHAFQIVRELGMTSAGAPLPMDALVAMHWTHRFGALVTFVYLTSLSVMLMRAPGFAWYGRALLLLVMLQVALGAGNVLLGLPLPVAVSHNAGAALLLVTLTVINFALSRKPASSS
jgi:cytochrome c oxidase assembly protein subunit 15